MASLNKVMLIGNAGHDAELRYTASGTAKAEFSLAVNSRRRDDRGEWVDVADWFNVVLWKDQAERLAQYITKGKPLYVEGRLWLRDWVDDHGAKHYRTEVIGQVVQLLGSRDDVQGGPATNPDQQRRGRYPRESNQGSGNQGNYGQRQQAEADALGIDLDDLPFE